MGLSMLHALIAAGIDAGGFDITDKGDAKVTTDLSDVFDQVETLITVVRDITQTNALLFETQELATAPRLKRIIICSTLSPNYLRTLRKRISANITCIDAPMSGAQIAAQQARLSFMLGGNDTDIAQAMPLFQAMGASFHQMGAFGAGMQAKVLNNLLAASNTAMTRLVLDWADAADLDPRKLLDLIQTSSGQNWFATEFDNIEFASDGFAPDNTIGILVKDVQSALDSAPAGADTALPEMVQAQIRALKPRS